MIKRAPLPDGTKVTFVVPVTEVDAPMSVVGDFNNWDPLATPLRKRSNGTRSASVELPGGTYRFRYLADGSQWFSEADADGAADNEFGTTDAVLVV